MEKTQALGLYYHEQRKSRFSKFKWVRRHIRPFNLFGKITSKLIHIRRRSRLGRMKNNFKVLLCSFCLVCAARRSDCSLKPYLKLKALFLFFYLTGFQRHFEITEWIAIMTKAAVPPYFKTYWEWRIWRILLNEAWKWDESFSNNHPIIAPF